MCFFGSRLGLSLRHNLDYLLGITPIESKDRQTIADTLHLSLSTVCTLCNQPDCGTFIDHLIDDAQFSALSEYSTQLAHSLLLKDIVTTSFTKAFEKRLYAHFQAYDASAAPFITKEDFAIYLKKTISIFRPLYCCALYEFIFFRERTTIRPSFNKRFLFPRTKGSI